MKNIRWWRSAIGLGVLGVVLVACGGGGDSDGGNIRLVNATISHASLDLVASANSGKLASAVAIDTVSASVGLPSTSTPMTINDAGSATALVGTTISSIGGLHLALIAYEIDGVMQIPQALSEDTVTPVTGQSNFGVFDLAPDAGGIAVYAIPNTSTSGPSAPPTPTTTPTALISNPTQTTQLISPVAPGAYSIWVTSATDVTDVRLQVDSVTLVDQQNATLILTPTSGGVLVNGAMLVQQGAYTPLHNATARIRVVAAVSASAQVSVSAGSKAVATNQVSPRVATYVTVPAASTLSIKVNGTTIAAPTTALAAGTDSTLLVWGDPGTAKATLLADDNHASTTFGNTKLRVVNGLSGGSPPAVTWSVGGAVLDATIPVGSASAYFDSALTTGVLLEVDSTTDGSTVFSQTSNLQPGQVYSLFLFGNGGSPSKLVLDSAN